MSNTTLNRLLNLPDYLKRNLIFHAEGINFGIRWVDRLIRTFESNSAIAAINYPVDLYIDGTRYSGELEVRRDGTHAVHMAH